MVRVNKTTNNLEKVWKMLDDASGSLYEASFLIGSMVNVSEDIKKSIEMIDITAIDSIKENIEILIEEKQKQQ